MKYITSILFILIFLASCNTSSNDEGDQAAAHDHGAIAILLFEGEMELFAETDQLYAGHGVDVRAHLTFLDDYSPASEGILYARIVQDQHRPDWEPIELAQAGIFTGSGSPKHAGMSNFEFLYEEGDLEVVFSMESLKVYSHDDEPPEDPVHGDEAIFTKEQAWKTEFGLMQVVEKDFTRAIHCSGEISVSPGNTVEVIAPAAGKIAYSGIKMIEGSYVRRGAVLFTLLGTGLSHDNILIELNTAKVEYEKSKANLDRKEKLLKIEAVSRKDYEEAKATYETDNTRYNILKNQIDESGLVVKSPVSGYITDVLSAENSYAETGTVLVKIIKDGGILVKANVPASQANIINLISSANIRFPDNPGVFSIQDWGGEVISVGRSIDPQTGMIPVFFKVNTQDLVPGTFVEIWLLTDAISEQVIIPGSSLLEEYGSFYVYVQDEGEAYEKRLVNVADNDGINYLIASGLEFGEVIVSKGAMAIKVANAMGAAPVHSH